MNPNDFLIRILVEAESKVGPVFEAMARQVDRFDQRMRESDRDAKKLDATLASLERRVEKVARSFEKGAAGGQVMDLSLRSAERAATALARRLEVLNRQADKLDRKTVRIRVEAATAKATADLAALERRADRAERHRKINLSIADGAGLQRALSAIGDALDGLSGSAGRAGGSVSGVGGPVGALAPLAAGAVVVLQQLASALVAVAGAAVAVGSAAGVAAAGIAGIATAAAAQAVPVVGLLAGAFSRVSAVMKVADQAEKARTASGAQAVKVDNARAGALDQLAQAHRGVVDAQEALNAARADGARQLQDLVLAERQAQLAAENSAAALAENLATAGQGGSVRALQLQRDRDALAASRQRTDTSSALAGGVEGLPAVVAARRQVEDASRAVDQARRSLDQAAQSISTAGSNYAAALEKLSPAEKKLLGAIERIKATVSELDLTDPIVRAFARGLDRADALLRDAKVLRSLRRLSKAIGAGVDQIADFLSSDEMRDAFVFFADEGAKNIKPAVDILQSLLGIFVGIARAASGEFGNALRSVAGWLAGISSAVNSEGGQSKLGKFFADAMNPIKAFIGLGGAVLELFAAVAGKGGAADEGTRGIEGLTREIRKATDWVNTHADEVREFFRQAVDATGGILAALFEIAAAMVRAFDGEQVGRMADAIAALATPLGRVLGWIGDLVDLFVHIGQNPIVGGLLTLVFEKVADSIEGVLKGLRGIVRVINGLTSLNFDEVVEGFKDLGSGIVQSTLAPVRGIGERLLSVLRSAWEVIGPHVKELGSNLAGYLINGVRGQFDFFRELPGRVVELIENNFDDVFDSLFDLGKGIVEAIVEGIKSAPDAIAEAIGDVLPGPLKDAIGFGADVAGGGAKAGMWVINKIAGKADGGPVSGPGSGTSDSIPAMLSNGEHIITAKEVQAAGGHGAIYAFRKMLGGGGQGSGGRFSSGGAVQAGMAALNNYLSGLGFVPGSTTGGNHVVGSWHYSGQATDYGDATNNMRKLWNILFPLRGQLEELGGPTYVSGGKWWENGAASNIAGTELQRNHEDHIHVAVSRVIQGLGRVVERGRDAVNRTIANVVERYPQIAPFVVGGPQSGLRSQVQAAISGAIGAANASLKPKEQRTDLSSSDTSGGGRPSRMSGNSVAEQIFSFFRSKGMSDAISAAWVGNAQQESGLNPSIVNSIGAAGLMQWLNSRRDGLNAFAQSRGTSWDNVATQMAWTWKELNSTESAAFQAIRAAKSIQQAVEAITYKFGRPGPGEAAISNRVGYAQAAFEKFAEKYANGGPVPGKGNRDSVPAMLTPGEYVLTKEQTAAISGDFDVRGAMHAFTTFVRGLRKFASGTKDGAKAFASAVDRFFDPGSAVNPFAIIESRISAYATKAAEVAAGLGIKVSGRNGNVKAKRLGGASADPAVKGAVDLDSLGTQRGMWLDELAYSKTVVAGLQKQLKVTTGKDDRQILTKRIADVRAQQDAIRGSLTQNAISTVERQEQMQAEILAASSSFFDRFAQGLDRIRRRFAAEGDDASIISAFGQEAFATQAKIVDLSGKLANARETGNVELAKQIEDAIDEANTRLVEIPVEQARAIAEQVDKLAQRRSAWTDRKFKVGEILGIAGNAVAKIDEQVSNAAIERIGLMEALVAAQAAGNVDDVDTISGKIADLDASVVDLTAQRLQAAIDDVNNQASFRLGLNDITQRLAALGVTGGMAASGSYNAAALGRMDFAAQGAALQARGGILQTQLAGLQGLLGQAHATGNQGAIQSLTTQIATLQADLVDNTKAIRDNTDAAFAYRVEQLQQVSDFKLALNAGSTAINDALGALSGITDTTTQTALLRQRQEQLQERSRTDRGLLQELIGTGRAGDLMNLSGNALASFLSNNAPGWLDPNVFDDAQLDMIRTLTQAILDNEKALLDNTKAMDDVSANVAQTFSTSAWRMFRAAYFNGVGGLIGSYDNTTLYGDAMASGASTATTPHGVAPSVAKAGDVTENYSIYITTPTEVLDTAYVGKQIAFSKAGVGRT